MRSVLVIGAGPAGMMAAIQAAERGASVAVLEKMPSAGRKLCISGKGRGNLTNAAALPEITKNIHNGRFLNSVLHAFPNTAVIEFFHALGVPTKVERGGRVFPESDRAADAADAMLARIHELGVAVMTGSRAREILCADGRAVGALLESGKTLHADAVILATGGTSYPGTGSTGDGYAMARKIGHTVTPILPSLVPLETEECWVKEAQGLSLRNVRATLFADGEKVDEDFGEMMFTHFGVTGPIILSLSRMAAQRLAQGHFVELSINLKPALAPEKLDARLQRDFAAYSRKSLRNAMHDLLPNKLILPVLDLAYLAPDCPTHQLRRESRLRLRDTLQNLSLTVTRTRPMEEAIVTAGGIAVREIYPKTMESKLVRGMYFAGEVVDVDGYTGGYNLQAAFSMGAAAGRWSASPESA